MIGASLPFDVREIPVSVLAYIGDAVFELYVRLYVAREACGGSGDLHRKSIGFVSARSQADAMHRLLPLLTEPEAAVYRRSRNHQSGSLPKHADPVTYRIATGFEGLIGYLYLRGEETRLDELIQITLHPPAAVAIAPDAAMTAPDAAVAIAPDAATTAVCGLGAESIALEEETHHET